MLLVAMGWLPGLALLRLLLPGQDRLRAFAVAPAVSVGMMYTAGQFLTRVGLPVDERVALACLAFGVLSLIGVRRRGYGSLVVPRLPWALPVSWAAGALIWGFGIRSLAAVPPHDDGYNHGLYVARVASKLTLDTATIIPNDVLSGGHATNFYPLALHQQAAVLVRVLSLDVATAWTLTSLFLVVIGLPVGMLALGRWLFPTAPRTADLCAVAAAVTPGITYSLSQTGGYTLMAGFAVVPGVLLALRDCIVASQRHTRWYVAVALALAGLAGIHTSEYALVAVLVATLLLLPRLQHGHLAALGTATLRTAAAFALSLLFLTPVLAEMRGGVAERSYPVPPFGVDLVRAVLEVTAQFSFLTPDTPPALLLCTWIGIAVLCSRRQMRAWLLTMLGFAVVYVWLGAFPSRLNVALTTAWYSDRYRLGFILAFLSVPLVAVALAGPRQDAQSRRAALWRVCALPLALVTLLSASIAAALGVHTNYRRYSTVHATDREAFDFMHARLAPGERVLNQAKDGSPWMYSLAGVPPVVALSTGDYTAPMWAERMYLLRHLDEADSSKLIDRLLSRLHIRFVFVGSQSFYGELPELDPRALSSSTTFRVVFSKGGSFVFERVRAGAD